MGNKHSAEELPNQQENPQRQRLSAIFRDLAECGPDGQPALDATCFAKKMFHGKHQGYTDLLFNAAIRNGGEESNCAMNESNFVAFGEHLLHLTDRMQQLQWYFGLFSTDGKMTKQDMLRMLHTVCLISYSHVGMELSQMVSEEDVVFTAMVNSVFGQTKDTIEWSDFKYWSNISCVGLFQGLHAFTLDAVYSKTQQQAGASSLDSEVVTSIQSKSAFLSWTMLWAVCASLSQGYVYFPTTDSASSSLEASPDLPLDMIVRHGGWQQLYSSNKDGLSVTRFKTKVFEYKGHSVTMFSFQDNVYCLALDEEWRETTERLGGVHSGLIQILPQYKHMQGGAPMVYCNLSNRTSPQNISIGKTPQTTFIKLDSEFSKVNHYGVDASLTAIEVWGCASRAVRMTQLEQQKWNETEVEKHKNRKLKIGVDEWKESPDRQILELGGVTTEHAER